MSLLLDDAPAWQPTPIAELSDFNHWPFNEVLWVETETVMKRGHQGTFWVDDEPVLVDDFSPSRGARRFMWTGKKSVRLPILGNWTNGIPIIVKVHTTDDRSPFWIFRHHYYCWKLNWMMTTEVWERFKPEPFLRHGVVEDFLRACRDRGLFQPHPRETRWFPATWRDKELPPEIEVLGEEDQRYKGNTFPHWLYNKGSGYWGY